jgi:hypothetical protein
MAFKKVATSRKYFKYADCNPGDVLVNEGTYVGPEEGRYGVQHIFKQRNGEIVCLNSSGHLNWLIENHVSPGVVVNILYKERVTLTKGPMAGKDAHNFELEVEEVEEGVSAKGKVPTEKAPPPVQDFELDEVTL